ncbi:allergen Asp f 7-like [Amphibalanus amphitrite]|uniref:allergen Asp f 7-like n=1 Tax=Amphibalanus amphitrite TaxID=1232801 RepID=UPI001C8FF12E|nr:allergen Asp f 7-like [Amphibalanus amphitrite]XP_043246267.1 allergen Asp f 7-like [Amphibalanus amphitrite]
MNISIQMCQLLALCLAMTAVEGMRVRVRGRRPRPFIRHGRPRRPVPVFLAVPGGQAVPVFPLGGQPQVQPTEAAVAVTEPQSPAPLSLSPAHPQPPQPSPSEVTSTAPTEPALPRPAAPAAFDNFDEDFFDESGPFGGSLPPFPDISAIFSDVATGRSDPTSSSSAEGGAAPLTQENVLRRLDSDWQGAEDDSS